MNEHGGGRGGRVAIPGTEVSLVLQTSTSGTQTWSSTTAMAERLSSSFSGWSTASTKKLILRTTKIIVTIFVILIKIRNYHGSCIIIVVNFNKLEFALSY
jgi:hypothetical protein